MTIQWDLEESLSIGTADRESYINADPVRRSAERSGVDRVVCFHGSQTPGRLRRLPG